MTPAAKAYYDYKESVDKGYSGGLIPEIINYVNELEEQREELTIFVNIVEQYFGPYTDSGANKVGLFSLATELQSRYGKR